MHAARQQHGEIGFAAINRIHQPVALAAMLLLLATALLGLAPRAVRRSGHARGHRDGGAARQCFRLRRAVEPA